MADEDFGGTEDESTASPGKGLNLKLIIILVAIGVVMGGAGFFAGKIFSGGKGGKEEVKAVDTAQKDDNKADVKKEDNGDAGKTNEKQGENSSKEGDKTKEPTEGNSNANTNTGASANRGILPLDAFTVNLNDPFGRRYVEVELKLVIDKKESVPRIRDNELVMPKIRNEILMTLSAKSYNDLRTVAGKVSLMEEIQMRVNEVLKQELGIEPVVEVLQTKFLMQ